MFGSIIVNLAVILPTSNSNFPLSSLGDTEKLNETRLFHFLYEFIGLQCFFIMFLHYSQYESTKLGMQPSLDCQMRANGTNIALFYPPTQDSFSHMSLRR